MLRITILNDGTGDEQVANYTCLIRTDRTVIVDGRITGHARADGWRVLALRAIAPGMLEALENLVAVFIGSFGDSPIAQRAAEGFPVIRDARAAIAKTRRDE